MIDKILKSENTLNMYRFGSHVYGTNNKDSDEDYYVIQKTFTESESIDIHHVTVAQFEQLLLNQDIQALECVFLPSKHILKESVHFTHILDKVRLRKSISTVSDNSFVKGKKKLIVAADYDKKLALKSIFHSLRIRDIGTQVALEGKIVDYAAMNWILKDLYKLGEELEREELWNAIDTKYRSVYNNLRSQFVELCPKDSKRQLKINKVVDILKISKETLSLKTIKAIVDEIG